MSASELPEEGQHGARDPGAVDEWLAELLKAGPVKVADIEGKAKSAGTSYRSAERAKGRLHIKTVRHGGAWAWSLPEAAPAAESVAEIRQPVVEPPASAPVEQPAPSRPAFPAQLIRNSHAKATAQAQKVPLAVAMGRWKR
jgi:hypothetical protein